MIMVVGLGVGHWVFQVMRLRASWGIGFRGYLID